MFDNFVGYEQRDNFNENEKRQMGEGATKRKNKSIYKEKVSLTIKDE